MKNLYFFSVFVVATCGLVYELVAGALASYLLGDSITQFSTIIGCYLFAMGVGSYLSKFIQKNLVHFFVKVEILIGVVGGLSAAVLFLLFDQVSSFRLVLYLIVFIIGMLVGIEIPLIMRILKDEVEFKDLVSKIFSFDYIGALLASLLFPLVLVPHLGLIKTALLFGMINVAVAFFTLVYFQKRFNWSKSLLASSILSFMVLFVAFIMGNELTDWVENMSNNDKVVYSHSTSYQKILITQAGDEMKLFLNGNLQFSSRDEYRYHESLVHPALASLSKPKNVLIFGGGDGLAAREVLKYPSVEKITLVDLDRKMTEIFSKNEFLTKLNQNSLLSEKLTVINQDAFIWIKDNKEKYDFIVVDFPDPSNFSLGKLYSLTFYRYLLNALTDDGFTVIQSTSPFVARKSFWCIDRTLQEAGFLTFPYHSYVPSFGEWGYIIAGKSEYKKPKALPTGLKFVSVNALAGLFDFPGDMNKIQVSVNKLNNQNLVKYFEDEWSVYSH